ncbi:MAG TPA: NUDIX hydrolase [Chloroflexi bacterium]|nr:NUDIX hydrolase [Chloroflexota bacterium]
MTRNLGGSRSPWETLKSEKIYANPWFALRQDQVRTHTGAEITYTFMEHPGAVGVVPLTPAGEIILIRSYRYTVNDWCWEVPMGGRDHENIAVVARKELKEEIGGESNQLEYINFFYANNGVSNIRCEVFLARNVRLGVSQPEDGELIEIRVLPKAEVFRMARAGEITDGMSALCLFLCEPRLV